MLRNYVAETSTAPGTSSTINLAGAITGRLAFVAVFTNGAPVYYFMTDGAQTEWGAGTFNTGAPNTLTRTTVIGNSAGTTARLNFTSSTTVYSEIPAERVIYADAALLVTLLGALSIPGALTVTGASTHGSIGTFSAGISITTGGLMVVAGGITITAGGLTISAGGAAITGNSAVTGTLNVSATLTAANGLVVTTGGATITAGGLTITAGGLTVSAGGAAITGNSTITGTLAVTQPGTVGSQVISFSQFPVTVGTTGSITLPNGLIMKWGTGSTSSGSGSVSFASAFPTSCDTAQLTISGGSVPTTQNALVIGTLTSSGFPVFGNALASVNFVWFAIGH